MQILNEATQTTQDDIQTLKDKVSNCVYYDENFDIYCNREINIQPIIEQVLFKLTKIANEMGAEIKRKIDIHIVDDRKDFLILSDTFGWCTGLSTQDNIFIIHPNDYKGTLYNNVLLHECLHCLIYQYFGHHDLVYEEGFATLFSTPLHLWKKELKKEENAHYYDEALHLQEIYKEKGMIAVLAEMNRYNTETLSEDSPVTVYSSKMYPIYLFCLQGQSLMASAIRKFTKSDYTHAALSLSLTMNELFSFNLRGDGGFRIEGLNVFKNDMGTDEFKFKINVCYVNEYYYKMLKQRVDFYKKHRMNTSYNTMQLFNIILNKVGVKNDMNLVCSTFVASILSYCGIKVLDKDPALVTPKDLANSENGKTIINLYEGTYKNFSVTKLRYKLNNIRNDIQLIASESYNEM